jgi:hypothetical protein
MHHIRQPAWSQPPHRMTVGQTPRATQAVNWVSTWSMPVLTISHLIRRRLTCRYRSAGVWSDYSPLRTRMIQHASRHRPETEGSSVIVTTPARAAASTQSRCLSGVQ